MPVTGPLQADSDARAWGGSHEQYPFEARAETFAYSRDAATGQDEPLRLEAGDEFVLAESDGATSYVFRCAERTTGGRWTLVWDVASSDTTEDGRVSSGGPCVWAKKIREGELVPVGEWRTSESTGPEVL